MATCPRCKGPLTDDHHCPRRTNFVALQMVAYAAGGALVGWLLLLAFDPNGQVSDDLMTLIIGAIVGIGIHRLIHS